MEFIKINERELPLKISQRVVAIFERKNNTTIQECLANVDYETFADLLVLGIKNGCRFTGQDFEMEVEVEVPPSRKGGKPTAKKVNQQVVTEEECFWWIDDHEIKFRMIISDLMLTRLRDLGLSEAEIEELKTFAEDTKKKEKSQEPQAGKKN